MERTFDFTHYKFRCSQLGKLMVGVKPNLTEKQSALMYDLYKKKALGKITDKQMITLEDLRLKQEAPPTLSETTKNFLKELHVKEVFGKSNDLTNKYCEKGIRVEEESISLYSRVTGELFIKNRERFENEFLTGEPDNIDKMVRDLKSSWSFSTFPMYETEIPTKDYEYQLQGYMALTGLKRAELVYCLVDTPELMIEDEKRRMVWKLGFLDLPDELADEIERNMTYSDIPEWMRVKRFHLEYDDEIIQKVYGQIKVCRKYLQELSDQLIIEMPVLR